MQLIFPVGGLYGQQAPVALWFRPSSIPQSVAGPFWFLDRGCGTSCPMMSQRRRHCQASGIDGRHIYLFQQSYPDILMI